MVLEKTLESPLDNKEIQPVYPKGNQSWVFIGRTDAEAETPIFWPPDAKNQLIGKDSDTGKYRRQEEKGMTGEEMVGWHHQFNGRWVWANSGKWWRTGKPGMLQSMGLQRVRHNSATEQQVSHGHTRSGVPLSNAEKQKILGEGKWATWEVKGFWRVTYQHGDFCFC